MLNLRNTFKSCICSLTLLPAIGMAQIEVIDPDKDIQAANPAARDTEKFEIGFYTGVLSVEDFNTNPVFGFAFRYYPSQKYLIEASYGTSETERSTNEGDRDFNPERDFSYFSLAGGYQLLEGRSFLGKKRKFNTGLYLLAGLEQVDFAEDSNRGFLLGASYKTVLTDWLTANIDFKNHIVNRDFLDEDKLTINTEFAIGINFIF